MATISDERVCRIRHFYERSPDGQYDADVVKLCDAFQSARVTIREQAERIERLKEYEWMYKDLCP